MREFTVQGLVPYPPLTSINLAYQDIATRQITRLATLASRLGESELVVREVVESILGTEVPPIRGSSLAMEALQAARLAVQRKKIATG